MKRQDDEKMWDLRSEKLKPSNVWVFFAQPQEYATLHFIAHIVQYEHAATF